MTDTKRIVSEVQSVVSQHGTPGDCFGYVTKVSPDGNSLAVSSFNEGTPTIFIYTKVAGLWQHFATLTPTDTVQGSSFGCSMSFSEAGDVLAVGCMDDSEKKPRSGAVYIYQRVGNCWLPAVKVFPTDILAGAHFGAAVKLSKDASTLVVGAPGRQKGAVFVFTRHRSGAWVQLGNLTADDEAIDDGFGSSLDMSNDGLIVVGAPSSTVSDLVVGSVYLFVNKNGEWILIARLMPSDMKSDMTFGDSVSFAGGKASLLITAGGTYEVAPSAYIFEKVGVVWKQTAKLPLPTLPLGAHGAEGLFSNTADEAMVLCGYAGDEPERTARLFLFSKDTDWKLNQEVIGTENLGYTVSADAALAEIAVTSYESNSIQIFR